MPPLLDSSLPAHLGGDSPSPRASRDAAALHRKGVRARDAGRPAEALRYFLSASQLAPTPPHLLSAASASLSLGGAHAAATLCEQLHASAPPPPPPPPRRERRPPAAEAEGLHGWCMKQGRAFPHRWQRRLLVLRRREGGGLWLRWYSGGARQLGGVAGGAIEPLLGGMARRGEGAPCDARPHAVRPLLLLSLRDGYNCRGKQVTSLLLRPRDVTARDQWIRAINGTGASGGGGEAEPSPHGVAADADASAARSEVPSEVSSRWSFSEEEGAEGAAPLEPSDPADARRGGEGGGDASRGEDCSRREDCSSRREDCSSRREDCSSRREDCSSRRDECSSRRDECSSRRDECSSRRDECSSRRDECSSRRDECSSRRDGGPRGRDGVAEVRQVAVGVGVQKGDRQPAGASALMVAWGVKQGSGFPYSWKRRVFVLSQGGVLRYYAPTWGGEDWTLKGEVRVRSVSHIDPRPVLSLLIDPMHKDVSNGSAPRTMLVRPEQPDVALWLRTINDIQAVSSTPTSASTPTFSDTARSSATACSIPE